MANFSDLADEETKLEADEFIELIETDVLKKRILTNTSKDYPLDKAYESVKNLIDSEDSKELMKEAYSDKSKH